MSKKTVIIGAVNFIVLSIIVILLWSNPLAKDDFSDIKLRLKTGTLSDYWQEMVCIKIGIENVQTFDFDEHRGYYIGSERGLFYLNNLGEIVQIISGRNISSLEYVEELKTVFVATQDEILQLKNGNITTFANIESGYVTDILVDSEHIFVADATRKTLSMYSLDGEKMWEVDGYDGSRFRVPSPFFDLARDEFGGVWITDPGRLKLVNFDVKGRYISSWQPEKAHEFIGCCNPTFIEAMSNGKFVTLSKGVEELKIFSPSGALEDCVYKNENFNNKTGGAFHDFKVVDENEIILLNVAKGEVILLGRIL